MRLGVRLRARQRQVQLHDVRRIELLRAQASRVRFEVLARERHTGPTILGGSEQLLLIRFTHAALLTRTRDGGNGAEKSRTAGQSSPCAMSTLTRRSNTARST